MSLYFAFRARTNMVDPLKPGNSLTWQQFREVVSQQGSSCRIKNNFWGMSNNWWKFWQPRLDEIKQRKLSNFPPPKPPPPPPLEITIPSNREKSPENQRFAYTVLQIKHLKHLWASTIDTHDWPSKKANGGSWRQTSSTPHTSSCPPTLAKWGESWARPWRTPWCTWTCSCWWTSYLVPPNGSMCQEKREAPTYCGFQTLCMHMQHLRLATLHFYSTKQDSYHTIPRKPS